LFLDDSKVFLINLLEELYLAANIVEQKSALNTDSPESKH